MNFSKIALVLSIISLSACGGGSGKGASAPDNSPSSVNSSIAPSSQASSAPASSSPSSSSSSSDATQSSSVASSSSTASSEANSSAAFTLTSNSFSEGATIPAKYTCDGSDQSPHLTWQNPPEGTKSFVAIVDDPDAVSVVGYTWVHWNVYNIGAATEELREGASTHSDQLPLGSIEGVSDFGSAKYRGPCPPSGRHHYHFQVYALNVDSLNLSGATTAEEFETANKAKIIAKASLTAYFR